MLEVRNLHASYGNVQAVRGVSLGTARGRITLVLGANGAGKSTTLRSIVGLMTPVAGTIVLDGEDVTGRGPSAIVRRGLALVPEGRRVFAQLTVLENLRAGAYTADRSTFDADLDQVLDLFPILRERIGGRAGLLSGGEQQMLAFGRALMSRPTTILMDEPSMGLAPAVIDVIMAHVRRIADSGIGVLMVEQNAEAGLAIADDVVIMATGEMVFSGTVAEARSDKTLLTAFLGDAAVRD